MTVMAKSKPKEVTIPILYAFDEFFVKEVQKHPSNWSAFETAAEKFEDRHGFKPPFTYEGFRRQKREAMKNKETRN